MKSTDIEIPFVRGQDTSGSPKAHSEPGKFRRVHNLSIQPGHADALSVRNSATSIASFADTGDRRISECEGNIVLAQPTTIRNLNSADSVWATTSTTRNLDLISVEPLEASRAKGIRGTALARDADGDEAVAIVSIDGANVELTAQVTVSGAKRQMQVVFPSVVASSGHYQAVFMFAGEAGHFILVFGSPVADEVLIYDYDKSNDTWTGSGVLSDAFALDSAEANGAVPNGFVILYRQISSTRLRVAFYSKSPALGPSLASDVVVNGTQANPKVGSCVQVSGASKLHIWSGEYDADSNRVRGFTYNLTTFAVVVGGTYTTFGTTVAHLACCDRPSVSDTSWGYAAALPGGTAVLLLSGVGLATIAGNNWCPRIEPMAKMFSPPSYTSSASPRPFLLGSLGSQLGIWQLGRIGNLPPVNVLMYSGSRGSYNRSFGLPVRGHTLYTNGESGRAVVVTNTGPEIIEWGLAPARCQVTEHAGFPIMAMGSPKYFDSSKWVPMGFSIAPDAVSLVAGAGGVLAAGAYSYALVWEWNDARGRRHQSPASTYTLTVSVNQLVTITVYTYSIPCDERLQDPSGPTRLVVYRTQAGKTTFHRAFTVNVAQPSVYGLGTLVAVDNTVTDALLAQQEILYTTEFGLGELQAFGLDAADFVVGYSGRIVFHNPAYPNQLFYSKTLRPGRPFECNANLSLFMPDAITGLAAQDGNIYAFSARNVYSFSPQFANDDGTGGAPIDPLPLSPDIGLPAAYSASVVQTPDGVFFRGLRGFYRIPRGGGPPEYIGLPLEGGALLSGMHGGAHNPATSEICWVTSFGVQQAVVYNYLFKQWFTWALFTGDSLLLDGGVAALHKNGFFYFAEKRDAKANWTLMRLDAPLQGIDYAFPSSGEVDRTIEVILESADFDISKIGGRTRVTSVAIDAEWTWPGSVLVVDESHNQGSTYSSPVFYAAPTDGPSVYQVQQRKTQGVRFRLQSLLRPQGMRLYGMTVKCKELAKAVTSSASRKG